MRPALPAAEYCGGSATPGCRQPTADLPAAVLAARREGRHPDASHVHRVPVGRGGAQLFPGSLATGTPQAFPVASSGTKAVTLGVAAHHDPLRCPACAADRPTSARFEPALPLAGVPPLVHCALHRPALLAGPGPSGSADPSRRCQGCSHPAWRLPGRATLSFNRAAATAQRWVLSPHPVTQRLVAHPLSPWSLAGRLRGRPGRPCGRLIGGTTSTTASSSMESWVLAAESATARGMPLRSTSSWYLLPGLPRSVGFGPVSSPPAWRAR
jgi:hypothetical protein